MISLIAVVGSRGEIGPGDGLPRFSDPEEQTMLSNRASKVTEGGVIVVGSNTAKMMSSLGIRLDLIGGLHQHAVWSRDTASPLRRSSITLLPQGKSVFICGGKTTFPRSSPLSVRTSSSGEPTCVLIPTTFWTPSFRTGRIVPETSQPE